MGSTLPRPERIAVAVVALNAAGVGVLRLVLAGPAVDVVERTAAALAFTLLVLAPAVLIVASPRRPGLLPAAGLGLLLLVPLSFAGVTLPLLVPAVFVLVVAPARSRAHATQGHGRRWPLVRAGAAALVVAVGLVAGTLALLVHEDPRSWTTAGGVTFVTDGWAATNGLPPGTSSGSISDVVTIAEAGASATILAAAVALALAIAGPAAPVSRASGGAARAAAPATPRR